MNAAFGADVTLAALGRALPYVRLYRGRTFVVKLGGSVAEDRPALAGVIEQVQVLVDLGIRVVLVHGGGPQTTALAARLGVPTEFVGGRRITPPPVLEVAVMAQNGLVNTALLAACRACGLAAVGVSGLDAGMVRAHLRPKMTVETPDGLRSIDFGEVGDVDAVDPRLLHALLEAGLVPVVGSLAADDDGRVLNVNADTVAARLATALGAHKLVFLTEAPGLLENVADPSSLVSVVDLAGLDALAGRGALSGGILPKLEAARRALAGGVPRIHVVGFARRSALLAEVFTNEGAGTLIVRDVGELPAAEHAGTAGP